MRIKLNKKTWITTSGVIAFVLILSFFLRNNQTKQIISLNQENLAQLVKPSVVKIVQHTTGEIIIPSFDFNFSNLTIKILNDHPKTIKKIDEYLSGSGFVVGDNGYILTNSHVVSEENVMNAILTEILDKQLSVTTQNLTNQQLQQIFPSESILTEFQQNALEVLKKVSTFNLQSQLVALNPAESQEFLTSLMQSGFKAEIINANPNFEKDQKDIALIKINASNLPSLKIGNSDATTVGNPVYAFGFPATGEINKRSPLEPSLTKGLISAIKFSQNKDFKIFQTDSKISAGSSGGPLFNEQGEVIGLITFQTNEIAREKGDNFAFAIPINLAKFLLEKYQLTNSENNFNRHFKQGLFLFQKNKCESALLEFEKAVKTNTNFIRPDYLDNYKEKCKLLTAQGYSVNNKFSEFFVFLRSVSGFGWFVILGRIILIIFAAWALYKIFTRIKQDENQITYLELQIENQENRGKRLIKELNESGNELPLPETELHSKDRRALMLPHPGLAKFIMEARKIGMADNEIKLELSKNGWDEEEILHTFKTLV